MRRERYSGEDGVEDREDAGEARVVVVEVAAGQILEAELEPRRRDLAAGKGWGYRYQNLFSNCAVERFRQRTAMKADQNEEESDNEDGLHVVVMEVVTFCAFCWPTVLWPSSANGGTEPPNRGLAAQHFCGSTEANSPAFLGFCRVSVAGDWSNVKVAGVSKIYGALAAGIWGWAVCRSWAGLVPARRPSCLPRLRPFLPPCLGSATPALFSRCSC